jgi:DNA-binding transcriptional LysR family regulator
MSQPPFRLDANLLVALDALLRERNVTRAARRMGLTQSAMSHVLGRLRAHFADPLLVRAGRGLAPTALALALAEPVHDAVAAMRRLLAAPAAFDPAAAQRVFRVALTDGVGHLLLPALLARLAREAPGVRVQALAVAGTEPAERLAAGTLDLAITFFDTLPPSLRRHDLYTDRYAVLLRRGHPAARRLDPATYASLRHIQIGGSAAADSKLDQRLREQGVRREVALAVPQFLLVPGVVARTDLAATLSRRLALAFAREHALVVRPLPVPLPAFAISQVWHERHEDDPAHRWWRGQVARVLAPRPPDRTR